MLALGLSLAVLLAASMPATRACAATTAREAGAAEHALSFAVVADLPQAASEVAQAGALLDWVGKHGKVAFVVHLGNLKNRDEPCSDALFAARRALLDSSPVPLIYLPGENDWIACARPAAGGADPLERLDALRETLLGGTSSLGHPPLTLTRQSEMAAFHPYRENVRWSAAGVLFVTLDVPADNNHFRDGGGRNGEFEDREVANRAWIARSTIDAQRRHARALVFLFQGNPRTARERRAPMAWWFQQRRQRDGFAALRRDLTAAARSFEGPVLVVHAGGEHALTVESSVLTREGTEIRNLGRVEFDIRSHPAHWIRISVDTGRPVFHATLERLPPVPPTGSQPGAVPPAPASFPGTADPAFGDIATPTLLPLPPLGPAGVAEPARAASAQ
ncbi:hypothetical protein [Robbsia betulipollinis]|nr:hypothetical protein [Robbsia betulipollinis]